MTGSNTVAAKANTKSSVSKKSKKRSIKSAKTNSSIGQNTMSQFFPKVAKPRDCFTPPVKKPPIKSAFDVNRIKAIKNICYSPDLFSTQTQETPKPLSLYNFDYAVSNTSPDSTLSDRSKEIANTTESPALQVTQIEEKINKQRNAQNAINGFVRANAIFDTSSHGFKTSSEEKENEQPVPQKEKDVLSNNDDYFLEFDDDELAALAEEMENEIGFENQPKMNGLNVTNTLNREENTKNNLLSRLNLNLNAQPSIRIDFEDSSDSDDTSDCNAISGMNTQESNSKVISERDAFFSEYNPTDNPKIGPLDQTKWCQNQKKSPENFAKAIKPKTNVAKVNTSKEQRQSSTSSNQAVYGSPMQKPSAFESRKRKIAVNPISLDDFRYNQPPQLQPFTNVSPKNVMQQRAEFMAPDSQQLGTKKQKLSIGDLLVIGDGKKRENGQKVKNLRSVLNYYVTLSTLQIQF